MNNQRATVNRLPRPVAETIVACTRDHDWSQLPLSLARRPAGLDTSLLANASWQHRVAGCVYATLRHADWIEPDILQAIGLARGEVLGRHVRDLAELRRFSELFGQAAIPWLVFKGPVLASYVYPRPDLRTSGDIDLLISPKDARKAVDLLEGAGFRSGDEDWRILRDVGAGQAALVTPWGTSVDLHWDLIFDEGTRRDFAISAGDLLSRARTVAVGQEQVPTFDPVDTLLHLAVHAGLDGGTRLVWLKDLDQTVRSFPPQWDQVVERAHEWRAGALVALMLARTARVLQTPIPDSALRDLCPSRAWLAAEGLANLVSPVPRVSKPSLARLVARAGRSTGRSSLAELSEHSVKGLVYRAWPSKGQWWVRPTTTVPSSRRPGTPSSTRLTRPSPDGVS